MFTKGHKITNTGRTRFQKGHIPWTKGRERRKGKESPCWKGGKENYPNCIDCGKKLSKRDAKRCRICYSKSQIGENNPNWKGGYHKWYQALRRTTKYKKLRNIIFIRDNYTCQFCCNKGGKLELHHIVRVKDEKKLIFDENNCLTLCSKCHQKTKQKENSFYVFCKWIIELKNIIGD